MKRYGSSLLMLFLILVLSVVSIFIGAFDISLSGILEGEYQQVMILLVSRVPRLLAILCTGAGLSVAGLIMQNLCMNKFVSPSTGATLVSAQLGVVFALLVFPTAALFYRTLFAFVFSIAGTWMFVWFINQIKLKDVIMVPLIGIMFSSVIGGLVSYFTYEYDLSQILQSMLVGDFSIIIAGRYEIVFLILPLIIIAFIFANHFNIVGMGEEFSTNLGINYKVVLFGGLSIAALISASVVVTVGTISYIGLIVPNIVAMFRGDKMRGSLLDVALFGSLFVLICDILGRIIIHPYELPIELISGVIGSIIFIVMLFQRLNQGRRKVKRGGKSHG